MVGIIAITRRQLATNEFPHQSGSNPPSLHVFMQISKYLWVTNPHAANYDVFIYWRINRKKTIKWKIISVAVSRIRLEMQLIM